MGDRPIELPMSTVVGSDHERVDARRNRERILEAASCLIGELGVDAVSMDEVAARAGVGKGTLYRRFGDRASLIRALIDEPERRFQEDLIRGEPPLGPGAPPLERLHAFGTTLLQLMERNAPYIRAGEQALGGRFSHAVYAAYQSHVRVLLQEVLSEQANTEYLVDALLAPLSAETFLYHRDVRGMSLEEITEGWCTLATSVCVAAPA